MTKRRAKIRVVEDAVPERYVVMLPMSSRSTGEVVRPGTVVTRDGFLAGNSDDDINLYMSKGCLRAIVDDAGELIDNKENEDEVNNG